MKASASVDVKNKSGINSPNFRDLGCNIADEREHDSGAPFLPA